MIDRTGSAVAYTGPKTRGWASHKVGEGYVSMGNVLAGPKVVDAMAEAYEASAAKPSSGACCAPSRLAAIPAARSAMTAI